MLLINNKKNNNYVEYNFGWIDQNPSEQASTSLITISKKIWWGEILEKEKKRVYSIQTKPNEILIYLNGTSCVAIWYEESDLIVSGYVDFDFAVGLDKTKFTMVIFLHLSEEWYMFSL